jgi:hypothetical protein
MKVPNTLAYYDAATISAVKRLILQALDYHDTALIT